jgi:hypothetical protein
MSTTMRSPVLPCGAPFYLFLKKLSFIKGEMVRTALLLVMFRVEQYDNEARGQDKTAHPVYSCAQYTFYVRYLKGMAVFIRSLC